ncbi:Rib/alpha-like domain-containing protein, partial [Enterococcus faecalis]
PETTTPGEKPAVEVTVTYPDGTTDTVEVPVEVTKTPDADKYEPTGEKITVPEGTPITEDDVKGKVTIP